MGRYGCTILCSREHPASCWGPSGANFNFRQAEEGCHARCPKVSVPSHTKNCQKLLAWTRWKGVFDGQRKQQCISTVCLLTGPCFVLCLLWQEAQGPAHPRTQLNCRCGSGLHCTTRRNRIPASAEMLCNLRKSVTAFQISRYPEVCGKPGKTPQPGVSKAATKLNQLRETVGMSWSQTLKYIL